MKIIKLKSLIPIKRTEYRSKVLPLFGLLVTANFLFAHFFEFLHENFFILGLLLILNCVGAFRISILTWRRLLYFTKGKRRGAKTFFLAFIGEIIPLYNVYLIYKCMSSQDKKSQTASSLALRPLALCFAITITNLAISFPRAPKNLPLFLSPTLTYVSHVALDSYRVFMLQDKLENDCLGSDDWRCFQKAAKTEVFPATNSGIILAVAADALVIYKKKEHSDTNPALKNSNKRLLQISRSLLETNAYFLKENTCHNRITPLNLSGPVHMMTGLQNAYILQVIDTLISKRFANVAKKRLTDLADSSIEKAEDIETSRSIASIKESIIYDASHTCSPIIR